MAIIETDAILLKKTELRETSFLLDFYTKESGKIKGVIKGVRSPQPQFSALYEIFTLDRISFYERKNKDIYIIAQCELLDFFSGLRKDLERLGYAAYYAELINETCGIGEKNEDIFELLLESLKTLSKSGSAKRITRVFEIKLLKILGIMPDIKRCVGCGNTDLSGKARFSIQGGGVLCGQCSDTDMKARPVSRGTVNFMESVSEAPMDRVSRIKVSSLVGKEVEWIMRNFLDFHIQSHFKSVTFMRQIGVL